MTELLDVAIVGAGPYGLSLAAHLAARRRPFRIFGSPMAIWRDTMPEGMHLKSEGFASTLFDPRGSLSLRQYCREMSLPYADIGLPVSRELFVEYGLAFQRRLVPDLEPAAVRAIRPEKGGFRILLETGEEAAARRVVIATGISHYENIPTEYAGLPDGLLRHTARPLPAAEARGRRIAVLGAGSSAVDAAGLLHRSGAEVHLITRRPKIWFNEPPAAAPAGLERAVRRVTRPRSGLGLGWRSKLACDMPIVFHRMPERFRVRVTRGHLGPSATWTARGLVENKVDIHLSARVSAIEPAGNGLRVRARLADDRALDLAVDTVVLGTGYRVQLDRLPFLDDATRSRIVLEGDTPVLDRNFMCSVPGLYFVGVSAANSFGPLLRFAWGARYVSPRLAAHLCR